MAKKYYFNKIIRQHNFKTITTDQGNNPVETLPKTISNKRGGLGIWQSKVSIPDDFDAPLNDFQEYMS